MKKVLKASMISGAIAAEELLRKEESKWMEETIDELPSDSPLRKAASVNKALLGDFAGLPPGHPLIIALEEARLRFESQKEFDEESQVGTPELKLKKSKKIDSNKARKQARIEQDENISKMRSASQVYNESIADVLDSFYRLRKNIQATREELKSDRYVTIKQERLLRMLMSWERGLVDSRLNISRVSNGN